MERRGAFEKDNVDVFIERKMEDFKRELLETLREQMNREMVELGWKPYFNGYFNEEGNYGQTPPMEWSKVIGRRRNRSNWEQPPPHQGEDYTGYVKGRDRNRVPRPPGKSAITITVAPGSTKKYTEVMKAARVVKLHVMGINDLRCRKSITGAMILEVPGKDNREKADKLAAKLKRVFGSSDKVRVSRPEKMAEMRIKDLDDSVTKQEVEEAVLKYGECRKDQVMVGDVRRVTPRSMGTAWVRCPLSAARKIALTGRITVGWSVSRTEILPPRPLQCFRCLRTGHVKTQCRAQVDRSGRCFSCGRKGHAAKSCQLPLNCPICSDLGAAAEHRLGSMNCNPPGENQVRRDKDAERVTRGEKMGKVSGKGTPRKGTYLPTEDTLNSIMASTISEKEMDVDDANEESEIIE